ncbi:hypothetical protein [Lysobacter capsici]|uniref:hypothetical protein n=1 Tax=Lysobacter capsici TaxID=435897 RepID=UPI000BBACD40|nr:hypothetical protein [Lysobacter capsici]ATE73141.1 hypothetical protein CNO08_18330 [Lysobacter capsici]
MTAPERPGADARSAAKSPARSKQDELDWQAAKAKRPDLMLLMICTVLAAMVLVGIVRTHLEIPEPVAARSAERAASANATTTRAGPSPSATSPILERVFDSTLANLKKENAAQPEAQRRTAAYRSMLTRMIASAQLKLDLETFECGLRLCIGSLRGDAGAYATLFGAIVDAPLPVYDVMNYSTERERGDGPHRFVFSVNQGNDDASAPARPDANR